MRMREADGCESNWEHLPGVVSTRRRPFLLRTNKKLVLPSHASSSSSTGTGLYYKSIALSFCSFSNCLQCMMDSSVMFIMELLYSFFSNPMTEKSPSTRAVVG